MAVIICQEMYCRIFFIAQIVVFTIDLISLLVLMGKCDLKKKYNNIQKADVG